MGSTVKTKFGDLKVSNDVVSGAFDSIPIVDLAKMKSPDLSQRRELAMQLKDACTRVGFFYIKNHGIDASLVDRLHTKAHEYFSLPIDEKMKCSRAESDVFRGYTPLLSEFDQMDHSVGSLCEGFDIGYEFDADPQALRDDELQKISNMYGENAWPDEKVLPGFRATYLEYYANLLRLSRNLLKMFALALDLPEDYFDAFVTRPGSMSRLIHYPPQPIPGGDHPGIAPHTDFECFTILSQDSVRALQVLNSQNQWIMAEPIKDHFVVNVGDFLQFWTNGLFRSTFHSATNLTGLDRYSIPFFFGVNYDAVISVLDSCITEEMPLKNNIKSVVAGDYVRQQLDAVYNKPFEALL